MPFVFLLLLLVSLQVIAQTQTKLPLARDAIKTSKAQMDLAIKKAKERLLQVKQSQSKPDSLTQINSPRILTNNLPPDALQSILSSAAGITGNQGPITILPPRIVSPGQVSRYEKHPNLALRKMNKRRSSRRLPLNLGMSQSYMNQGMPESYMNQGMPQPYMSQGMPQPYMNRGLSQPYLNPGPGYMDIGSNGYSPLSFAMMRPDSASMSPFVPRNTPPPPIRIQLQDPLQDYYKKDIMSESEERVSTQKTKSLEKTLKESIDELIETYSTTTISLSGVLNAVGTKSKEVQEKRDAVKDGVKQIEKEIEKMRKRAVEERRMEQVASLLHGLVGHSGNEKSVVGEAKKSKVELIEKPKLEKKIIDNETGDKTVIQNTDALNQKVTDNEKGDKTLSEIPKLEKQNLVDQSQKLNPGVQNLENNKGNSEAGQIPEKKALTDQNEQNPIGITAQKSTNHQESEKLGVEKEVSTKLGQEKTVTNKDNTIINKSLKQKESRELGKRLNKAKKENKIVGNLNSKLSRRANEKKLNLRKRKPNMKINLGYSNKKMRVQAKKRKNSGLKKEHKSKIIKSLKKKKVNLVKI